MEAQMRKYDLALSFAGEDRGVAEELNSRLSREGLSVFYDEAERAELWGKDLYTHLSDVYRSKAKYCLMIVSAQYANKLWTNHERKSSQARAFEDSGEYILPLRLDDTEIPGLLPTTGYLDLRKSQLEEVVRLAMAKVMAYNELHGIDWEQVRVHEAFRRAGIVPAMNDTQFDTECPACGTRTTLAFLPVSVAGNETIYSCARGCMRLVVVGRVGPDKWDGRGYRLGDYVVRNVRDIHVHIHDGRATLLIPASPEALVKPT
jgi:hypothetical protein